MTIEANIEECEFCADGTPATARGPIVLMGRVFDDQPVCEAHRFDEDDIQQQINGE